MGGKEGEPLVLTPDLAAWEAALRIWRYPRELWDWLVEGAVQLHNLVRGLDGIGWVPELKKDLREVQPEDLDRMAGGRS